MSPKFCVSCLTIKYFLNASFFSSPCESSTHFGLIISTASFQLDAQWKGIESGELKEVFLRGKHIKGFLNYHFGEMKSYQALNGPFLAFFG